MALQDITDIINIPEINCNVVCRAINFYREQGNTFIHPFITDKPETRNLKPETVLDITHESLIRNWSRLREWANEEHENYLTWQDFNKQLLRWKNNGRSTDFLLPTGTLSYFEEWHKRQKPNKYWVARYKNTEITVEENIKIRAIKAALSRSKRNFTIEDAFQLSVFVYHSIFI